MCTKERKSINNQKAGPRIVPIVKAEVSETLLCLVKLRLENKNWDSEIKSALPRNPTSLGILRVRRLWTYKLSSPSKHTHSSPSRGGQTHTSPSPSRGRQTQTQLRERTHRQENNIADTAGHICLFRNKKIYLDMCYCTVLHLKGALYISPPRDHPIHPLIY